MIINSFKNPFDRNITVLQAYEPSSLMGKHGTIQFFSGICHGLVGTDPDPASYAHLSICEERFAAVKAAYSERAAVAKAAIREWLKSHPELVEVPAKDFASEYEVYAVAAPVPAWEAEEVDEDLVSGVLVADGAR